MELPRRGTLSAFIMSCTYCFSSSFLVFVLCSPFLGRTCTRLHSKPRLVLPQHYVSSGCRDDVVVPASHAQTFYWQCAAYEEIICICMCVCICTGTVSVLLAVSYFCWCRCLHYYSLPLRHQSPKPEAPGAAGRGDILDLRGLDSSSVYFQGMEFPSQSTNKEGLP